MKTVTRNNRRLLNAVGNHRSLAYRSGVRGSEQAPRQSGLTLRVEPNRKGRTRMRVIVKGVHLGVTPALRDYIEHHLVQPIARFYDNAAAELEVHLLDVNGPKGGGNDKECRVRLRMPGMKGLALTETSNDIFRAVALAHGRIERLTKRVLSKRRQVSSRQRVVAMV
jgi:putative sigma-54 modulation protein